MQRRRLPAIVSDIDGVVYRGGSEIGNSKRVIRELLNHKIEGKYHLPFFLLTNGGGIPEHERANVVNKIIGLDNDDSA
jgi:ribonucleotide monophosphatase NagD (HAD superfamily)